MELTRQYRAVAFLVTGAPRLLVTAVARASMDPVKVLRDGVRRYLLQHAHPDGFRWQDLARPELPEALESDGLRSVTVQSLADGALVADAAGVALTPMSLDGNEWLQEPEELVLPTGPPLQEERDEGEEDGVTERQLPAGGRGGVPRGGSDAGPSVRGRRRPVRAVRRRVAQGAKGRRGRAR